MKQLETITLAQDIKIKSYIRDIERSHFSDIMLPNKDILHQDTNLVFLFGNTIDNFDDRQTILGNLSRSCTKEDYIILTFTTDSPKNRAEVSYVNDGDALAAWKWMIELVGIDFNVKNLQGNYDSEIGRNDLSIVLDKDYQITFEVAGQELPLQIRKNEKITIWRHYLINLQQLIQDGSKAGLELVEYKLDNSGTIALVLFRKR